MWNFFNFTCNIFKPNFKKTSHLSTTYVQYVLLLQSFSLSFQAIDIFMSSCTVFVFLSLIEYAFVNVMMGDISEVERKDKTSHLRNIIVTANTNLGYRDLAWQQQQQLKYHGNKVCICIYIWVDHLLLEEILIIRMLVISQSQKQPSSTAPFNEKFLTILQ